MGLVVEPLLEAHRQLIDLVALESRQEQGESLVVCLVEDFDELLDGLATGQDRLAEADALLARRVKDHLATRPGNGHEEITRTRMSSSGASTMARPTSTVSTPRRLSSSMSSSCTPPPNASSTRPRRPSSCS